MASIREQERSRRRSKTHGWFDHGDSSLYPQRIRFADTLHKPAHRKPSIPHWLMRYLPTIRVALGVITWILATASILWPAIILSTTSVRSIQQLCQHSIIPPNLAICNTTWTRTQPTVLHKLRPGKTPLTTTIHELLALNQISASLEFIGLPLHSANTNLTVILTDLESNLEAVQLEALQSGNIGYAGSKAHELVESFSGKDYDFRHRTSIWDDHGIADLSEIVAELNRTISASSSDLIRTSQESAYHLIPVLNKHSRSYKLLRAYHNFVFSQLSAVEELVVESTETRLALQDFVGYIGQLETKLQIASPTHTDSLVMMRLATTWALVVVQSAEAHYKSMYSSLRAVSEPLAADVASYASWWLSGRALSIARLRALVEVESSQIATLSREAMEAQEMMETVLAGYMESEEAQTAIKYKLEAAAVEGKVLWL